MLLLLLLQGGFWPRSAQSFWLLFCCVCGSHAKMHWIGIGGGGMVGYFPKLMLQWRAELEKGRARCTGS